MSGVSLIALGARGRVKVENNEGSPLEAQKYGPGTGKHAAVFYVEIEPEFYGMRDDASDLRKIKATKLTQNRPEMCQGAVYVKCKIIIDDEAFIRVIPEVDIEIPVERTGIVEVVGDLIPVGPTTEEDEDD